MIRLGVQDSSSLDKLSGFLHGRSAQIDRAGRVVAAVARFGTDVVIFEKSFLTLAIAEMVAPVTPIASVCFSALAATALVAASIDMFVQIEELTGALANAPSGMFDDDDAAVMSKALDAFAKPFDAIVEKIIAYAGNEGAPGSDGAEFAKALNSYRKARAERQKATGVNKVKYILAEANAAKKVLIKGKELINKKLRQDDDPSPKGMFRRDKSDYPNGVDYPEQPAGPGAGPPSGDGGTAEA